MVTHEWNGCGPNFISFGNWKCWNFMGFMDFWVDSLLWSHELKWCQIPCLSVTGKGSKFTESFKIHVSSTMQRWTIL